MTGVTAGVDPADDPQPSVPGSPPPAGPPMPYRDVRGLAAAVMVLIPAEVLDSVLCTVSDWDNYSVVHRYLGGTADRGDLAAADTFSETVGIAYLALRIAAGVVFLTWLWRARVNSELRRGPAVHRRARGWTIGGWFVSVANLWLPYQIMTDVWWNSAPKRPVSRGLLTAWWLPWVVNTVLGTMLQHLYLSGSVTEDSLRRTANLSTLSAALEVWSGALIIVIVHRITTWQGRFLDPTRTPSPPPAFP